MTKVNYYADDVAIVRRWEGSRTWFYTYDDHGTIQGDDPKSLAALVGKDKYCLEWEHRCEGLGCNKKTPYKLCAHCHFENRGAIPTIGILGM